MKILILGCSHTAGAWDYNMFRHIKKFNNISRHNKGTQQNTMFHCYHGKGWPNLLAKDLPEHEFYVFAHPGGGMINYLITLGAILEVYGKRFFDKIIVQYTEELRLTIYNIRQNDLLEKFPYNMKALIEGNIKIFDYNFFKNSNYQAYTNCIQLHNYHYVSNYFLKDFVKDNLKPEFEMMLEKTSNTNKYKDLTKLSLKNIIDNFQSDMFTFNCKNVSDRINCIEDNLYDKLLNEGDGVHLNIKGIQIMYNTFKNDLINYIKNGK